MNEIEDRAYPMREIPMEVNWQDKPYTITITPLDRGYTVTVGCKSFAFIDQAEMMNKITAYLTNPEAITKLFNNNKLF